MYNTEYTLYNNRQGFVTLISVVVVGAALAAIAASVIVLGLDVSRSSLDTVDSARSRAYADACAEEALEIVRDTPSFTGTASLTFSGGGCSYDIAKLVRQARVVETAGIYRNAVRKVRVAVSRISPSMVVESWREVADF